MVPVIPRPIAFEQREGSVVLDRDVVRVYRKVSDGLVEEDGYALTIDANGVEIRAASDAGEQHAEQTLRQLVPVEGKAEVPAMRITDAPLYAWRGLHLDVARHMFSVAEIKRLLDTMAFFKLNRFHWHLTDDQGWRIEIPAFPRLAEIGAQRAESPKYGAREEGDGTPYGGFYTRSDIREVVEHAEGLGITVVPEIDLPGHMQAAIAAYPELGHGAPPEVWTRWGVSERILNVKPATIELMQRVLGEVASMFPGEWIHLGGDEVPTTEWESSPEAQALISRHDLAGERQLQGWFLERMAEAVRGAGRRPVCWDEVLECDGPADAVVMAWREAAHARTAAARGHDVVLCPQPYCYFDHYQGPPESEPEAIGGFTDLRQVLSFDPLAGDWTEHEMARLLGVQGNLWSEYIHDAEHLEYMAWPRGAALAEVAWSMPGERSVEDFESRWRKISPHLDAMGVNHRRLDT